MSGATETAQKQQTQRHSLIVRIITLPLRLLGVLIGALLMSIVIE